MDKAVSITANLVRRNRYNPNKSWKSLKWQLSRDSIRRLKPKQRSGLVTISGFYKGLSEVEIDEAISAREPFTLVVRPAQDSKYRGYCYDVMSCQRRMGQSELQGKSALWIKLFLQNCHFPKATLEQLDEQQQHKLATDLVGGALTNEQALVQLPNVGDVVAKRIVQADVQKAYKAAQEKEAIENFKEDLVTPYQFSDSVIKLLMTPIKVDDQVIKPNPQQLATEINNNLYSLIRIKGLGLETLDEIYLSVPGHTPYDLPRVKAKIMAALTQELEQLRSNFVLFSQLRSKILGAKFDIKHNQRIISVFNQAIRELNAENKLVPVKVKTQAGKTVLRLTTPECYLLESNVAEEIGLFSLKTMKPEIEHDEILQGIQQAEQEQGFKFTDEQKSVIEGVVNCPISSINGYAGTGKSSIMRAVDKIFVNKFGENSIAQCSFTGRAADSLSKSSQLPAKTAHAQMGIYSEEILQNMVTKYTKIDLQNNLTVPVDDMIYNELAYKKLFVIDEYPTLDLRIFALILRVADMVDARLILVGDSEQLPAISTSTDQAINSNNNVKHFNLSQVKRQGDSSRVYTDSLMVRQGKMPTDFRQAGSLADGDLRVFMGNSSLTMEAAKNKAINLFLEKISKQKISMNDIAIISPSNQTNAEINQTLHNIFVKNFNSRNTFAIGNPKENKGVNVIKGEMIINTHNFYQHQAKLFDVDGEAVDLFNGNIGRVDSIYTTTDGKKMMNVDFGVMGMIVLEEDAYYTKFFELAYAITVHKAQGSTIPHTIAIAMTDGKNAFQRRQLSRQMIYTAMTRASEELDIITSINQIKWGLENTVHQHARSNLDVILGNVEGKVINFDKKKAQQEQTAAEREAEAFEDPGRTIFN